MSMAIGHFAVGASSTMVMLHMLPLRIRLKITIARGFIVILGGLWAMLPDLRQFSNLLHHFNDNYWTKINLFHQITLPDLTVFIDRMHVFHDSRWANICFFHQLMDVIDKRDSVLVSGALVLAMVLIISVALMHEITERRTSKHNERISPDRK